MTSTLITSVDICALRIAKLTTAGAPNPGASNAYKACSVMSLGVKTEVEGGDDKSVKNGCGDLCAILRTPDLVKGITLDMELCLLDAQLNEMLTGAGVYTSGGNAIGGAWPAVGVTPSPVCIEAWSKAWDNDQQAVPAFTTPSAAYIHWIFPFTRWTPGDVTLENDISTWPVTGVGSENDRITANGPFDDWPASVSGPGLVGRLGSWFFDSTLPTCDGSYSTVTSAAS